MTANAFGEDATRCLDAGMNVHLAKPLEMKELIPVLKVIRRYKFSKIFKSTRKNLKHLLRLPFPPKSSNPSEGFGEIGGAGRHASFEKPLIFYVGFGIIGEVQASLVKWI